MKTRSISKSIVCCLMACVAGTLFFSTPNQADAQITYTVTGFTGLEGDVPGADVRSYTAVFEIDASVTDSDNDPNRGEYTGAIISSSIVFDDGLVSSVDFAGGDVTVRPDFGGGGFFLIAPEGQGTFTLYSFSTLPSDALLLAPQVMDLPGILFFLEDETGLIVGYTDPEGGVVTGALEVSASPVLLGDCNLDSEVDFQDIDPFISSLFGDGYLAEADMNEDGDVTFLDIDGFINALSSN